MKFLYDKSCYREILDQFREYAKSLPMGVDRTDHLFLVAVNMRWEDAVEAFLAELESSEETDDSKT